jgi:hypothetical protein
LGRLIDRTGDAVLTTHHNLSMFRLAGEPLDFERLVHVDGYIDLQLAEPIQVGPPYEQRVNRSVEKIRHTIEALRRDGKRVTKLAVAQVGRMSHTTVHKHWVKATSA